MKTKNKWQQERKHHCEICNVWIPPTKASIASHERGEQHQSNIKAIQTGTHRRNHKSLMGKMIEQQKLQYEILKQSEQQRSNPRKYNPQGPELDIAIQDPGALFGAPVIIEPIWSARFDDEGKVYYRNRLTKKSMYEKPQEFDGYDPTAGQGNEYLETFNQFKATPFYEAEDQGVIGQWTDVKEAEQFMKKHKAEETEIERETREKEEERLKKEILGIHSGVRPTEDQEKRFDLKLNKKDLLRIEEESDEEEEANEEEKNLKSKRKAENMKAVISKQTIELVEKAIYHEEPDANENVQFRKCAVNKKKEEGT